jgi:hypothetical protein
MPFLIATSTAAPASSRLRADMEAQAAALRNVLERQGGEVAALRAAAAAAEAQSTAAKVELAQVGLARNHCTIELLLPLEWHVTPHQKNVRMAALSFAC